MVTNNESVERFKKECTSLKEEFKRLCYKKRVVFKDDDFKSLESKLKQFDKSFKELKNSFTLDCQHIIERLINTFNIIIEKRKKSNRAAKECNELLNRLDKESLKCCPFFIVKTNEVNTKHH